MTLHGQNPCQQTIGTVGGGAILPAGAIGKQMRSTDYG
jgi:hypothetical protein